MNSSRPVSALWILSCLASTTACRPSSPAVVDQTSHTMVTSTTGAANDDVAAASPSVVAEDASATPAQDAAASADATTQETPSPLASRLRAMAASDDAFLAGISPTRGLTVVHYLEAPPSGRGRPRRENERVCPATFGRRAAALRQLLTAALARADAGQDVVCDASSCVIAGMEYEPARHFTFVLTGDAGSPTLESMEFVSEAAMPEPWLAAARAYRDRALAAHRRAPCPAR